MEDYSNFGQNLQQFAKFVDSFQEMQDIELDFLAYIKGFFIDWDSNHNPSLFDIIRSKKTFGKKITKDRLQYTKKIASDKNIDSFILNTVISAHGTLDLGTFLRVPENTIIVAFVNEGRSIYDFSKFDYEKNEAKKTSVFIVLWMNYLISVLEYSEMKRYHFQKQRDYYYFIKKFIIGFVEMKNKYMVKYQYLHTGYGDTSDYYNVNNDIVIYYENDLIPNQIFRFNDLSNVGIMDWKTNLDVSFNSSELSFSTINNTNHPFYNIYEYIFHKRNSNRHKNEIESKAEHEPDSNLVEIVSEMERRLESVYSSNRQYRRPINVLHLFSCRPIDFLTLKPHVSFLFKNLPHKFKHIMNRRILNLKEHHRIPKWNQEALKFKFDSMNLEPELRNYYVQLVKNSPEEKRNKLIDFIIKSSSEQRAKRKFHNELIKKSVRMDVRIGIGSGAEIKSVDRTKLKINKAYDIFYDKLCMYAGWSRNFINKIDLYYFSDVKKLHDTFPTQKRPIINSYTQKIDILELYLPVRDESGIFANIWSKYSGPGLDKNNLPFSIDYNLAGKIFYIPRNMNTELVIGFIQSSSYVYLKPFILHPLLRDTGFRENVFTKWLHEFQKYTIDNVRENKFCYAYIQIMRLCFVDVQNMRSSLIEDILKSLHTESEYFFNKFNYGKYKVFRFFDLYDIDDFNLLYFLQDNLFRETYGEISCLSYFLETYRKPIQRDFTFPYLTPLEYLLANYFYDVGTGQVLTYQDYSEKSESLDYKKQIAMFEYNRVVSIMCNLERVFETVILDSESSFSLYEYFEMIYKFRYRDILLKESNKYSDPKYSNYLTIFPGNFIFQLDYLLSESV